MLKRALITGITGQDGSYLAELLLGIKTTTNAIQSWGCITALPSLMAIGSLLITTKAPDIDAGLEQYLFMGPLDSLRDWCQIK